jgi:ribosomal protein S18 acetylase RimI-like enzyme
MSTSLSSSPAPATEPPRIVPLSAARLDAAAESLGRAFHEDPLQRYVLPDAAQRRRRSPAHFRPVLAYGLRYGEVFTTEAGPLGAAVWLPPGATAVTEERAASVGMDRLGESIGEEAAARFYSVLGYLDPFHEQDVREPHWYTMVVGVSPEAQGRGLGRALLRPVLERAAAAGQPCYLETAQPANVGFYRALGFRVVRDMLEPGSGLRLWTFRWDARA